MYIINCRYQSSGIMIIEKRMFTPHIQFIITSLEFEFKNATMNRTKYIEFFFLTKISKY